MENKKPWQSRTIVLNAIGGLVSFLTLFWGGASEISGFIAGHAMEIGLIWSVANIILRTVTKDKITLTE